MDIAVTIEARNYAELSGIMAALGKFKKKWDIQSIHDTMKVIKFVCDYSDIYTVLKLPFKSYNARRSGYHSKEHFIDCQIRDEHNNITYESHSDGYYEDNTYSAESNHKLIKKITHYPDGQEETEVFYPYK